MPVSLQRVAILFVVLSSLCAVACGPPDLPARVSGTQGALPPGVKHTEEIFGGAGQAKLYGQTWRPETEPKASLVVVHGLKDHGTRYAELAVRLAQAGVAVHALDLRGHGHSGGVRVYVEAFDDYLGDLDIFLARARASAPDRPVFLFGHSMGGAIATLYTITRKPKLSGLVLSGAALELGDDVSSATVTGTKLVAALASKAQVFQLELTKFSRDPKVVAACAHDPLVFQEAAPANTAAELLGAIGVIGGRMEEVRVPLLVMHGSADVVTPPLGSRHLHQRARSTDKTLKIYPGLYHDLLHEPEKETVLADVAAWIEARTK